MQGQETDKMQEPTVEWGQQQGLGAQWAPAQGPAESPGMHPNKHKASPILVQIRYQIGTQSARTTGTGPRALVLHPSFFLALLFFPRHPHFFTRHPPFFARPGHIFTQKSTTSKIDEKREK